jgi:hypothetical protein
MVSMNGPRAVRTRRLRVGSGGRWLVTTLLITVTCSAASCQSQVGTSGATAAVGTGSQAATLDDHVTWQRDIVFTDSAASASIQVYFDPKGGFVVADGGQSQIRVYSEDGRRLLWSAGQSGNGPQDFETLRSAVRTSAQEVVALDMSGKLSFWSAEGRFKRTAQTGLGITFNSWLLNDSTLLISGRRLGESDSPLLHVWDLRNERMVSSFFETPPHDPRFDEAYRYSSWVSATRLGGDSLAVIFPRADTLYLYRTNGSLIDKLPLALEHFVPLREPAARNDTPEAQIEWRNSYSLLSQVYRAPDGSIYVQYFKLAGLEPVWGLARLLVAGDRSVKSFEVFGTPRLLGISPRDSSLYFIRADLLESTVWSVANLSR